jgi:hypothetical protein
LKQQKPNTGVYVSILERSDIALPNQYWIELWDNAELVDSHSVPLEEKEYVQELIASAKDAIITPYAAEYLRGIK